MGNHHSRFFNTSVRVIAFHFVKRGYIELTLADGCQVSLEVGEIGICFGGVAHSIFQGDHARALPVETLLLGKANSFRPGDRVTPRPAALTCGVFLIHHTELNPLFTSLPSLLHLDRSASSFTATTELLLREVDRRLLGSSYVIERLLELLCAEAVRCFVAANPDQGWFSSLQDPIVGKAISLMHAQPQTHWTVEQLAAAIAISPRFAARFSATLQDSPMSYLAKWRMNLASRLLIQTTQGVEEIAHAVGYTSLPAFNRAFKQHLGLPPIAWRHNKSMKQTVEKS